MLQQQIKGDVIVALKTGDHDRSSVLRMTVAALSSKEKEKRYAMSKKDASLSDEQLTKDSVLTDDEAMDVIISEIKKRRDAIALYQQGERPELAEKEQKEIEMLQKYLPEQLSADELKKLVAESVEKVGAKEMKDMGKVMADLMPKVKGKADNKEISNIIKELLAN